MTSEKPTVPRRNVLRIGEFHLSEYERGFLWLANENGEGMQVDPQRLERWLKVIWRGF